MGPFVRILFGISSGAGTSGKSDPHEMKHFRNFLICRAIYGGLEDPDDLDSPKSLDPDPNSNNMDPRSTTGRRRAKFIRARRPISMAKLLYGTIPYLSMI